VELTTHIFKQRLCSCPLVSAAGVQCTTLVFGNERLKIFQCIDIRVNVYCGVWKAYLDQISNGL
jgi:hypothetical protein